MIEQSPAERARRAALVADTRGALAQGITIQERQARCESRADAWLAWFQREMTMHNCDDPAELLPDACARLEAIIEDRVAWPSAISKPN